jgi:hypothetical protein
MDQVQFENAETNYLYVPPLTKKNKNSKAKIFINKYKTVKRYGQFEGEYSVRVTNMIRQYLDKYNIEYGVHGLFGKSPLSTTVGNILVRVGLKKRGADLPKTNDNLPGAIGLLRKMKISEAVLSFSPAQRLELSKRMMHSLVIQQTVYRMNVIKR